MIDNTASPWIPISFAINQSSRPPLSSATGDDQKKRRNKIKHFSFLVYFWIEIYIKQPGILENEHQWPLVTDQSALHALLFNWDLLSALWPASALPTSENCNQWRYKNIEPKCKIVQRKWKGWKNWKFIFPDKDLEWISLSIIIMFMTVETAISWW